MKSLSIHNLFLLSGILLVACSCNNADSPDSSGKPGSLRETGAAMSSNHTGRITVAEKIIYDVEIINPDPGDKWTAECLEGLDHKALVDFIFQGIYSEKFPAYDIFEGKPISARKIRRMEDSGEFTRDQIGKFQFREKWVLDTLNMTYTKKVTEVRMGIQNFNDNGTVTGYAPLLKVVLP